MYFLEALHECVYIFKRSDITPVYLSKKNTNTDYGRMTSTDLSLTELGRRIVFVVFREKGQYKH